MSFPFCIHGGTQRGDGTRRCLNPLIVSSRGVTEYDCHGCGSDGKNGLHTLTPPPPPKPRMGFSQLAAVNRCKELKKQGLPCDYDQKQAQRQVTPQSIATGAELSWAYGITTVPEREDLLQLTLRSLSEAGFDKPRIFLDGRSGHKIKLFANWFLGMMELYTTEPKADRYCIFQDDILACKNLRRFLNGFYPQRGYINLICYPNQASQLGWQRSPQKGKGAQGLVFSREALKVLVTSQIFIDHTLVRHDNLDGAITNAMNNQGWSEYIHSPSLLGHTGRVSSKIISGQPPLVDGQPHIPFDPNYDPLA